MHGRAPTGIVNRAIEGQPAWQAKLERFRSQFGG